MITMEVVEVTSTLTLTLKMAQNIIFERTWHAMLKSRWYRFLHKENANRAQKYTTNARLVTWYLKRDQSLDDTM